MMCQPFNCLPTLGLVPAKTGHFASAIAVMGALAWPFIFSLFPVPSANAQGIPSATFKANAILFSINSLNHKTITSLDVTSNTNIALSFSPIAPELNRYLLSVDGNGKVSCHDITRSLAYSMPVATSTHGTVTIIIINSHARQRKAVQQVL